jgi:EAL domain-containing protein (putative c-di-GMP-specific phosphodiesterase class I)
LRYQALEKFSQFAGKSYLAINISPSWIDSIDDPNKLPTLEMLNDFKLDKSRIIIELTETKGDLQKLTEIAKVYRSHGLKVAIDDFGSGYSQLDRVIAIRPDIIKLDMRLFKQASKKGGIASDVVHLLTRLAKRTGCQIVCEGVETDNEFFFALNCGTHMMQGFLFSPATADFQPVATYQRHVQSLRKKFLQRAVSNEQKNNIALANIKKLVKQLQQALQTDFNLNELAALPFEENGILGFYICNNEGEQISSSFVFSQGKWFENPKERGFNWSWRPYFYQLLALEQTHACDEPIASDTYRDFDTDKLCKTLSIRLDEKRILLVDTIALIS